MIKGRTIFLFLFMGSVVKVMFSSLSIKPCGLDTDNSFAHHLHKCMSSYTCTCKSCVTFCKSAPELKEVSTQRHLPSMYFLADWNTRKTMMATLASDWLRHFGLLFYIHWIEFNQTWQKAITQCRLPSLCFWSGRKTKMAALAPDWLRYFKLLLFNCWSEFNKTWQFCIFWPI